MECQGAIEGRSIVVVTQQACRPNYELMPFQQTDGDSSCAGHIWGLVGNQMHGPIHV